MYRIYSIYILGGMISFMLLRLQNAEALIGGNSKCCFKSLVINSLGATQHLFGGSTDTISPPFMKSGDVWTMEVHMIQDYRKERESCGH